MIVIYQRLNWKNAISVSIQEKTGAKKSQIQWVLKNG